MITGKKYIGSTFLAHGTKTFSTFNPENNEKNTSIIIDTTSEEIDQAVVLTAHAF
jgi:NADP-dependent aldehyde dehydrogenase